MQTTNASMESNQQGKAQAAHQPGTINKQWPPLHHCCSHHIFTQVAASPTKAGLVRPISFPAFVQVCLMSQEHYDASCQVHCRPCKQLGLQPGLCCMASTHTRTPSSPRHLLPAKHCSRSGLLAVKNQETGGTVGQYNMWPMQCRWYQHTMRNNTITL